MAIERLGFYDADQVKDFLSPGGAADLSPVYTTTSQTLSVSDAVIAAGMPLAVNRTSGHMVKADASSKPISFVVGLADQAVGIGEVATAANESLTLADWTAVVGSATLSHGSVYFLAAGGGLTTTAPSSPNMITIVGEAASTTTMIVRPQPPIQL
jgi:hypothetical protein